MACYEKNNSENSISILRAESSENGYTEYVIEVGIGSYQWVVRHRYSEFYELNEQLVGGHELDKKLLPPKKTFGNTSEAFIQKRRSGLERYLQAVLKQYDRIPYEVATFFEFQKYEINGVTQILAETLFSRGDALLQKCSICSMDPLQLHSITTRMTKPETVVSSQERDIGHILDFVTRLKKLRVIGTDKAVGTSNINMNNLEYNLAMFRNLTYLELMKCDVTKLNGLDYVRKNLKKLKLKRSLTNIQEFLMHNALYWEAEGEGEQAANANLTWPQLTWVDFSENDVTELPDSMRYLEKMEYLDLHDNYIDTIQNLESCSYLTHIDMSMNRIECLSDLHLKLGNIKTINLAGNKLETLSGFSKLYSLEYLDVSSNQISQVIELKYLGSLPLLESLIIQGNAVTVIPDYRIQVLKIFENRAKEVSLDNKKATDQELSTVAVLLALDQAKRPSNGGPQQLAEKSSAAAAVAASASTTDLPPIEIVSVEVTEPAAVEDNDETAASNEATAVTVAAVDTVAGGVGETVAAVDTVAGGVGETVAAAFDESAEVSQPADLNINGNNESLDTSDLQNRLQGLSHNLSQVDTGAAVNSRFDSPFNSPTRSSVESDQQFHSLSSTPKETLASTDNVSEPADDLPALHVERPSPDGESTTHNTEQAVNSSSYAGSEISSPSASFSVHSDDMNGDDEGEEESVEGGEAGEKADITSEAGSDEAAVGEDEITPRLTLKVQAVEAAADGHGESRSSLSPLNISLDVVDHLEKCLANIPNTIKLTGPLSRLTQMDGEELLNLFYHDSLIRQAGDGKEELCHAMWTSLSMYNSTNPEQACLVLLSNQATYFITSDHELDSYSVSHIRHQDLQEVCVGAYHQSVRLGGATDSDYYCCITRDPSLVHIFTTRVSFIVDTDFVKAPSAVQPHGSDSEDEVSIYDTQGSTPDQLQHPSGVRFLHDEEQSLEDLTKFLTDCNGDTEVRLISADFVHLQASAALLPRTLCLTESALYMVKEMYAGHPTPTGSSKASMGELYALERTIRLKSVGQVTMDEEHLRMDVTLRDNEILSLSYSSLAMAKSFIASCTPLLST